VQINVQFEVAEASEFGMAPILALLAACNVRPSWGWAKHRYARREFY